MNNNYWDSGLYSYMILHSPLLETLMPEESRNYRAWIFTHEIADNLTSSISILTKRLSRHLELIIIYYFSKKTEINEIDEHRSI